MLAKLLEDNLNRRNELANPETTTTTSSEGKTDTAKRARQGDAETPQEYTGGASSSSAQADVNTRLIHVGERPLEPDRVTDMVCGLDVCDEPQETQFSDTYVNDNDGD